MKKTLLFLCVIASFSLLMSIEQMVVRFENPDRSIVEEFTQEIYDVASFHPGKYLDIVVTVRELAEINERGYYPRVTQTEQRLINNLQAETRIDGYRSYEEVLAELQEARDNNPDIVRIYDIGDSWAKIYTDAGNDYYQNYAFDIWALKLTSEPDSLRDKPAVFYFGGHHAREPLSVEVTLDFLLLLLEGYGEDEEITYLVDNTEIWFVPLVNPDGHKIVLERVDVWWRKNIRDNNNNGRFDTNNYYGRGLDGVDLNRNYAFEWAAGNNTRLPTYPGPEPGSEPEVAAIKELMSQIHFVAGITYHTYSELVLFSYGYAEDSRAPDHETLKDLAVKMAATIPTLDGEDTYKPMQSVELYPARGITDDYAYGKYGIFCYTFELATEFIPPPEIVRQVSDDNMEAAMILLRRIYDSTLTGIITDAITGEPLTAEVYIEEIDDTGSFRHPYTARQPFGRYYRILLPGEYTVVFKADGYYSSEPYRVIINEEGQTELDTALYPMIYGQIAGTVVDFHTNEPLEDASIALLGSSIEPVFTGEDGTFYLEEIPYYPYLMIVSKEGYGTIRYEIMLDEPIKKLQFEMFPPYLTDIFDNDDNWITSGDWGLSATDRYVGDYSLSDSPAGIYNPNTTSFALLKEDLDLSGAYDASVSFMAQYRLTDSSDYCYFQVLPEAEEVWDTLAIFTDYTVWENIDLSLAQYCGQRISVRFLFSSGEGPGNIGIFIDDFKVFISDPNPTGIESEEPPYLFTLMQNYPNPFNSETTISFSLMQDHYVKLEIFTITGRKVVSLTDEMMSAGKHTIAWDGFNDQNKPVGSGVYFYRLTSEGKTLTKKMVLLK